MFSLSRWLLGGSFFVVLCSFGQVVASAEDISTSVAENLKQGKIAAAEASLQKFLLNEPKHSQARFELGVVQVLSAIEKLGQDQYRYGALSRYVRDVPILRLPIPLNPDPKAVTYQQVRQIFVDFQTRLMQADSELAKVELTQELKLPIDLMAIRLDLTADGKCEDEETFMQIFGVVNRTRQNDAVPDMRVTFDAGDVPWLRGYCHLLSALCDIVLAYDHQRMFDLTGQLIYPKHVPAERSSETLDLASDDTEFYRSFIDLVAAIHLMNVPLKEPARMESARQHLLEMIRTSRKSWVLIQAETDNDREWLPNPKQTGILRIPVTRELIDGWHAVLAEMEDLLEGRKLIPFWRDYLGSNRPDANDDFPTEGRGVNLKRFFAEPREFDLILIIQGSGVLPYVEHGPLSQPETWNDLSGVFRGQFFGFAVWFN